MFCCVFHSFAQPLDECRTVRLRSTCKRGLTSVRSFPHSCVAKFIESTAYFASNHHTNRSMLSIPYAVCETKNRMSIRKCNTNKSSELAFIRHTHLKKKVNLINVHAGACRPPIHLKSQSAHIKIAFQLVFLLLLCDGCRRSILHSRWPLHWHKRLEQKHTFPWLHA